MTTEDPASTPPAQVTIVVVPRERFSVSLRSLMTLLRCTEMPFDLVYVDGNSPPHVRDRLREEAGRYGFDLVRVERYLSPNQARNLGLQRVRTPYVVFVDNDVIVTPGWLRPLVVTAEATGAWVVGALIFEGEIDDMEVHNAGGFLRLEDETGRRLLLQENRYGHVPRSELPEGLERLRVDYVEFHCTLVRREAFDAIGVLDEQLLSTREHLDLCMQVTAAGGEVWSELTSLVTYDHPPPVTPSDLPFFMLRWSEEWNTRSVRRFMDKYGLDAAYWERIGGPRARRHVVFAPLVAFAAARFGANAGDLVNRAMMGSELLANRTLLGSRARRLARSR